MEATDWVGGRAGDRSEWQWAAARGLGGLTEWSGRGDWYIGGRLGTIIGEGSGEGDGSGMSGMICGGMVSICPLNLHEVYLGQLKKMITGLVVDISVLDKGEWGGRQE